MRLFCRSPTNSRPCESIAMVWGMSSSPGPDPFLPQVLIKVPPLANLTIRALVFPPCPSATKMSPFGAVTTADGALNSSLALPGAPALPSVSRTLPSGLNLNTWWPLPPRPRPSTTQTLPSRSIWVPCGNRSKPAPKLLSSLPDGSNLSTGSRFEPPQPNGWVMSTRDGGRASPQRSATHTLVPSRSIATALVEPQARPCGSVPQFSIERYGFGNELVGCAVCARARP